MIKTDSRLKAHETGEKMTVTLYMSVEKSYIRDTNSSYDWKHVWGKKPNILEISQGHQQVGCDMFIIIPRIINIPILYKTVGSTYLSINDTC